MLTEIETRATEMDFENHLSDKLNALKEQGNYRYFLPLKKSAENHPSFKAFNLSER